MTSTPDEFDNRHHPNEDDDEEDGQTDPCGMPDEDFYGELTEEE